MKMPLPSTGFGTLLLRLLKSALPPLLIAGAGLLLYAHTIHAPFQMDEGLYIRDNSFVKEGLASFRIDPSNFELYKSVVQRFVGYATFAANYRLHGLRVEGYHVFNIAIHILNGILLYVLVLLTFRSPRLSATAMQKDARWIGFFAGLLFVAHPVQIEAVTYIMQRLASLAAFFCLLSLILYSRWRLGMIRPDNDGIDRPRSALRGNAWWYVASVVSAVLAMKTKESTVTLPIVIAIYEACFFSGEGRKRWLQLTPLLATMLVVPLTTMFLMFSQGIHFNRMTAGSDGAAGLDWLAYFATQMRVIITYYRLLLVPVNQNFLYSYPVYDSLLSPPVLLSMAVHAAVVFAGVFMIRQAHKFTSPVTLMSFGILWFYLGLAVESSVIPLPQVIFEYRMYLSSMGFAVMAVTAGFSVLRSAFPRKGLVFGICLFSVLTGFAGAAAYERNDLWNDNVQLWKDTARKSPGNPKVHNNLGTYYLSRALYDDAIAEFEAAIQLDPKADYPKRNLVMAYIRQKNFSKATDAFHRSLGQGMKPAEAHYYLGSLYAQSGVLSQAVEEFETALRSDPADAEVHYELANTYHAMKVYDLAIRHYQAAIKLKPEYIDAHNNLGGVFVETGRYQDAYDELQRVLQLNSGQEDARYNLQVVTGLMNEQSRKGGRGGERPTGE